MDKNRCMGCAELGDELGRANQRIDNINQRGKDRAEIEYDALKFAVARLNLMVDGDDAEVRHSEAETILCEFLVAIGAKELANAFGGACDRVGFWYA